MMGGGRTYKFGLSFPKPYLATRDDEGGVSYIIVCRNPTSKKLVVIMHDEKVAEYETEEAAFSAAQDIAVCQAWGAEIVPVCRPVSHTGTHHV